MHDAKFPFLTEIASKSLSDWFESDSNRENMIRDRNYSIHQLYKEINI